MFTISRIFEKVIWCLYMANEVSEIFTSTINVKRGGALSPIVFGFCITELERIIDESVWQEGIEEIIIGNVIIML